MLSDHKDFDKIWGPVGKVKNMDLQSVYIISIIFLKMLKFETWGKLLFGVCLHQGVGNIRV